MCTGWGKQYFIVTVAMPLLHILVQHSVKCSMQQAINLHALNCVHLPDQLCSCLKSISQRSIVGKSKSQLFDSLLSTLKVRPDYLWSKSGVKDPHSRADVPATISLVVDYPEKVSLSVLSHFISLHVLHAHELRKMKRISTGLSRPSSSVRRISRIETEQTCTPRSHCCRSRQRQIRHASTTPSRPRTALFFPGKYNRDKLCQTRANGRLGQGVQKVGMLTPWLEAFPSTAGPLIEEIDHLLGRKLSKIIEEGPNSTLTATENAQPAIMASSILILRILEQEYGFKPAEHVDVVLGHSLGEFAALVAGGFVSFEDSLYLVQKRAEVMADCSRRACAEHGGEYGMVALVTEPNHLQPLINSIYEFLGHDSAGSKSESAEDVPPIQQVLIGNINSKNQIVLSGNIERIKTLLTHVRQFGGHDPRAVRLKSDSPFHSPLMKPASKVMRKMLDGKSRVKGRESEDIVTFPGTMECISNVTARPFESKDELKDLWARSCVETVRWWDSIKYLDQEERVRRWIGIGPGKVGRNLVGKEVGMRGKDVVKGGGVWGITGPEEVEEVLRALEETESLVDEDMSAESWH